MTPTETPAGLSVTGAGQLYGFSSYEGAVGVWRLPSEQSDYCKRANDYLKRSYAGNELDGFKPYECLTVAVDNRQGSGTVNMYAMQFLDAEGVAYDSVDVSEDKGWMYAGEDLTSGDNGLYNEGGPLTHEGRFFLNPGGKGETTVFFKQIPENPTFTYIYPSGGMQQVTGMKVK